MMKFSEGNVEGQDRPEARPLAPVSRDVTAKEKLLQQIHEE